MGRARTRRYNALDGDAPNGGTPGPPDRSSAPKRGRRDERPKGGGTAEPTVSPEGFVVLLLAGLAAAGGREARKEGRPVKTVLLVLLAMLGFGVLCYAFPSFLPPAGGAGPSGFDPASASGSLVGVFALLVAVAGAAWIVGWSLTSPKQNAPVQSPGRAGGRRG